jgi:hypothetical protein
MNRQPENKGLFLGVTRWFISNDADICGKPLKPGIWSDAFSFAVLLFYYLAP